MILWDWFFRMRRRKQREELLTAAKAWPTTQAKLLPGVLVDKDELAEGTVAQDRQVEFPYYFMLESGYFGGHVRTVPGSEGEARRLMKQVPEGTSITVRYNPANPDQACVLAGDNEGVLPVGVWEG
jgi:hypothetical protein